MSGRAQPPAGLWRRAWGAANGLFFGLRQRLGWSRGGFREPPESKDGLYDDLPPDRAAAAGAREAALAARYGLEELRADTTRRNYRENLYLLDLLDAAWEAAGPPLPAPPRVLDVGVKNWYYVRALHRFLARAGRAAGEPDRPVDLTGLELDPYRVYADLYSRYDYARWHMRGLAGCRYLAGDFLDHGERYDLVLLLFPFVLERPLLEWGLPLAHFQPRRFLAHALARLVPGGALLVVNQGPEEAREQLELLASLGRAARLHREQGSHFVDYPEPRFVTIVDAEAGA